MVPAEAEHPALSPGSGVYILLEPMNQPSIQVAAKEFELVAANLIQAGHSQVREFYASMRPLVELAKQGGITKPMEWRDIPGGRSFLDTELREHADLESAFAKFRLAVAGMGSNNSFKADASDAA